MEHQRVKFADDCFSEWGFVPSDVSQGTKLGPWLFIIMINDLDISEPLLWKFVDDTTTSEIVPKGNDTRAQIIADQVLQWSTENKVQLNADKCKELRISLAKTTQNFEPIVVNDKSVRSC